MALRCALKWLFTLLLLGVGMFFVSYSYEGPVRVSRITTMSLQEIVTAEPSSAAAAEAKLDEPHALHQPPLGGEDGRSQGEEFIGKFMESFMNSTVLEKFTPAPTIPHSASAQSVGGATLHSTTSISVGASAHHTISPVAGPSPPPIIHSRHARSSSNSVTGHCRYRSTVDGCKLDMRQRFLVIGRRNEQFSASRYCLSSAALLAKATGRVLVAPSLQQGFFVDPSPSLLDAADVWKLQGAVPGLTVVHARDFLACFPLKFGTDKAPEAVSRKISVHTWRMQSQDDEQRFAKQMQASRSARVVFLPQTQMCVLFRLKRSPPRQQVAHQLSHIQPCIQSYAQGILRSFGRRPLVFHWRSITHPYHQTLMNGTNPKYPPLPRSERASHLQACAHELAPGVQRIRGATRSDRTVFFSDIHAGCYGGRCYYLEFERYFRKDPNLWNDRATAQQLLSRQGWLNGDEAVVEHLQRQPLFRRDHDSDQGLLGVIISEICAHAQSFLTCAEGSCSRCARSHSAFTEEILRLRKSAHLPSWKSWFSRQSV